MSNPAYPARRVDLHAFPTGAHILESLPHANLPVQTPALLHSGGLPALTTCMQSPPPGGVSLPDRVRLCGEVPPRDRRTIEPID